LVDTLYLVNAVQDTLKLALQSSDNSGFIIQIILALSAILASLFAVLTYFKTIMSRRAFIAPATHPGVCHVSGNGVTSNNVIEIKLVNYGLNPAINIITDFFCYNYADIEGLNETKIPVFKGQTCITNPTPNSAELNFKLSVHRDEQIAILMVHYIIFRVSYFDKILNKTYNDVFYWYIDPTDNKLVEVSKDKIDTIKQINRNIKC